MEEGLDTGNDAGAVEPVALELAHDLEELLVRVGLFLELVLDLLEVGEGVSGGDAPVPVPVPVPLRRGTSHSGGGAAAQGRMEDRIGSGSDRQGKGTGTAAQASLARSRRSDAQIYMMDGSI